MQIIMNLGSMVIGLVAYVLMAVGLYTIAKRRGIRNPWLAWIPVANSWLLGCISDQYQYVAKGRNKSRRKMLLILTIIVELLSIALFVVAWSWLFSFMEQLGLDVLGIEDLLYMISLDQEGMTAFLEQRLALSGLVVDEMQLLRSLLGGMFGMLGLLGVMLPLSIWRTVVYFMALYDLYVSTDPKSATVFLVLSIVLGELLTGIFVLVCKDRDGGMPPRPQPTQEEEPPLPWPEDPEEPAQDDEDQD